MAHSAGVISEPEMTTFDLLAIDEVVIIASDGLWEFMTSQQVLDFIVGAKEPKKAVDMLVTEASSRWMKEEQVIDDTTIIVAFLK